MFRTWAAATLAAAAVLTACAGASSTRADRPPPHRLNLLEANAEDVIDQVPHARWERIDAGVNRMRTAWRGYAAEARAAAATQARRLDRALHDLLRRSAQRDGRGTQQSANDVSAAVVELLGRYALGHPVAIGRLDVIGRQIGFDADRGDFAAAVGEVAAALRVWHSVRASVVAHRGRVVASRTDRTLEHLEAAAAASAEASVKNDANDLLELVDDMERLY